MLCAGSPASVPDSECACTRGLDGGAAPDGCIPRGVPGVPGHIHTCDAGYHGATATSHLHCTAPAPWPQCRASQPGEPYLRLSLLK